MTKGNLFVFSISIHHDKSTLVRDKFKSYKWKPWLITKMQRCRLLFIVKWYLTLESFLFESSHYISSLYQSVKLKQQIYRQSRGEPIPHYIDVIVTAIAYQITSLTVVYSTVYSDADRRKHQSSASLAFVWGIYRDRWIPRTKGQLRGKVFHLMTSSWAVASRGLNDLILDSSVGLWAGV